MRCRDLPEYLQKRIEVAPGRENTACWNWTGKVKARRQRHRPYPAIEGDGYREYAGRFTNEAAVPIVRHPITKKEEDARRHVYGAATMVLVCDVPTLKRFFCDNPRCVSPYHVVEGALTAAQRKRLEPQPVPEVETETETESVDEYTWDRCLALLHGAEVSWGVDRLTAANEARIPPEQLTEECWAHYAREEMAREEEGNDDVD